MVLQLQILTPNKTVVHMAMKNATMVILSIATAAQVALLTSDMSAQHGA